MRKTNILVSALILVFNCLPCLAATSLNADQALERLREGNQRYLTAKSAHPRIDPDRRRSLAIHGQEPIAAVLGCADARVPPEIVFDQPFGDLFVVRVAGNVAGPLETASLEYAVAKLHVPLIVVLGHTKCGAVQAAIANQPLPGSLPELMKMIVPAVEAVRATGSDKKDVERRTIEENVAINVKRLESESPIVQAACQDGSVKVVGAVRDIEHGQIDWLSTAAKRMPAGSAR